MPDDTLGRLQQRAAVACELCALGVPHHTNSATSIGGSDRHVVWDLHAVDDSGGVGLRECTAAEIWQSAYHEDPPIRWAPPAPRA